ncbi:beta-lactamase family protein [Paenibacillus eucommiae]|uniref:CubicO group peptidase (Beta-lactamase class C family) n=1 Tax=Paenibacillus eucommiae TaxID=1355755 RepID=A0ABS4J3P2_9BACL|nr:beta-lactamase family protein [Paenibacillus eucommiae]MBP1994464.1 CubicO group peptidase (beta-lactamase class C family) [Paenibacillus eucommiae]
MKHLLNKNNGLPRNSWMKGVRAFTAVAIAASLLIANVQQASANESQTLPASAENNAVQSSAQSSTLPVTTLTADSAAAFLDEFFSSEQAKSLYTGASAVIVKDGKVLAQKGYGYSDKSGQTAVDPARTVFRIASVSKTFTAAAIMQLVEQGKIDLKADFRKYAGDLKFDNPFSTPVTVEHLLTHTTGFEIRDPEPEDIHNDFEKFVEIEDYVRDHMPPVVRKPGSAYMYDNFASLLLGLIVQKVSGEPFEAYMERHLFKPLGMKSSGFLLDGELKKNLAVSYDAADQPINLYTLSPTVMPQGGMLSTAEDVGKFMLAFLNGGAVGTGGAGNAGGTSRILSENTVEMMEQYRSSIHPLMPDTTYGFEAAFQLPGAGSSSKIITKAGDLIGFSSYLFLIPEQNTGVFITYNKQSALRNLFYPQFISTFFPQYAAPAELEAYTPQSGQKMEKYSGLYADLRLKVLVSSLYTEEEKDGALNISDTFIGPRALRQVDDNLFVDDVMKQFTAFKLDESGEVAYMKEPYINPLGYARKGAKAAGFTDVNETHPYAKYILGLQSLGYYSNNAEAAFAPEQTVTRGDYVQKLLEASSIRSSKTAELAFSDLDEHPAAAYIQMAYELGMVTGNGLGQFEPNRAITRQESAIMLWRLLVHQYPPELFEDVKLAGETEDWAVQAVQMIVSLGIYGPEVQIQPDGSVDFHSRKSMTRQEQAAVLYGLFTQPTDQIVAAKAAQQKTDSEPDGALTDKTEDKPEAH